MPFGVVHSGNDPEIGEKYKNFSKNLFEGVENIPTYKMGCTIGTHIGPGVVGVSFFEKD